MFPNFTHYCKFPKNFLENFPKFWVKFVEVFRKILGTYEKNFKYIWITFGEIWNKSCLYRVFSEKFWVLLQLIVLAEKKKKFTSKKLPTLKFKDLLAPENPNLQKFVN